MQVTTIGTNIDGIKSKKKTNKSLGSNFSGLIDDLDNESTAASGSSSVSATNPLIFLQEVGDEEKERREAVEQGFDALKYLENIRNGLLSGALSRDTIIGLESLLDKFKKNFSNTNLQQVIEEIEVRAKVELAKLERDK